jgi:molecular chaperone DnaJ
LSQDHYAVLGLPRTASQEDIKKAFRRLAAEHHPDRGGNASKFKEVNTAHQVLTDEAKKAMFDAYGDENAQHRRPPPGRPGGFRVTVEDMNSVFNKHFDPFGPFQGGGIGDFARKARPAQNPGEDIRVRVSVPMEEALSGVKKTVRFDRGDAQPCKGCAGSGSMNGMPQEVCLTCNGSGRTIDMVAGHPAVRQCRQCRGSGSSIANKCSTCSGSGKEAVQREITVTIPKGLRSGQDMKVKGLGRNGSPPGDLILTVEVQDSESWWARGETLFTTVEVGLSELLRGGSATVRVPDGREVHVTVPAGGGTAVSRGAWKNPAGQDGDLVALFKVRPSEGLSPRAERLTRELLEELGGQGRRR